MNALIAKELQYQPQQLTVCLQAEGKPIDMHLSPLLAPDESPGKFHDVNVLGMDFLRLYGLTMKVHTLAGRFKLYLQSMDETATQMTSSCNIIEESIRSTLALSMAHFSRIRLILVADSSRV